MAYQPVPSILVPEDMARDLVETSTQPRRKGERLAAASKQSRTSIGKGAIGGRPRGVAKLTAKRTPRNRLLASLHHAKAGSETAKAAKDAASDLEGRLTAPVADRQSAKDGATAGPRFVVEISSDSPTPTPEPEEPFREGERLVSPINATNAPTQSQSNPLESRVATPAHGGAITRTPRGKGHFDSAAFDAAIYRQVGLVNASNVAPLASHRTQRPPSSSEDGRLFVHADPAIHLVHHRSERWHDEKAREIKARGGRKAWFGKVIERQRWLHNQEVARNSQVNGRRGHEPRTYRRPLDFGDVDESDLPEEVLRDASWRKACAWHREMRRMQTLRRRLALRSAQETRHFFRQVINGWQPTRP